MVVVVDELEEIDDVDESDLKVGNEFFEQGSGGERLVGWDISARSHNNIWFLALVVGGPVPDSETLSAVRDSFFHAEELEVVLLICDDDVDIVGAAQAMVCD